MTMTMMTTITHPMMPMLRWTEGEDRPKAVWLTRYGDGKVTLSTDGADSAPMRIQKGQDERIKISAFRTRDELERLMDIAEREGIDAAERWERDKRNTPLSAVRMGDWLEVGLRRRVDSVDYAGIATITARTSDTELEEMAELIEQYAWMVDPHEVVVVGSALPVLEALRARCV